jgi:hypothetical protein
MRTRLYSLNRVAIIMIIYVYELKICNRKIRYRISSWKPFSYNGKEIEFFQNCNVSVNKQVVLEGGKRIRWNGASNIAVS